MTTTQFLRGSVVLCDFPFVERPHQRGSSEHFCLFVHAEVEGDRNLVAVCYGTSRLDEKMLSAHRSGAIFSVPKSLIKISSGFMPGDVAHFVCDHVALIPESWINDRFKARLDFMRADVRQNDPARARMFAAFEKVEPLMQLAAIQAVEHKRTTGLLGLPPGRSLR
jgi:hypothetical protein